MKTSKFAFEINWPLAGKSKTAPRLFCAQNYLGQFWMDDNCIFLNTKHFTFQLPFTRAFFSFKKNHRKKCPPLIRIKYGHFDSSRCSQIWRIHHFWATIWWKVRRNCACNSSDIYRKARHLQLEFRHGITTVVEFSKYGPTFVHLGQIAWKIQNTLLKKMKAYTLIQLKFGLFEKHT